MDHQAHGEHHRRETHLAETDESLAARAASDPAALAELYSRHLPGIHQYCRFRLRDPEQAEDVCGQVFLKMIEGLRAKPVDRFRPWLYTIAHHEVVTTYRKNRPSIGLDQIQTVGTPGKGPEEQALATLAVDDLLRALPLLRDQERTVLELRLVGLPNQEICHVLGRSHAWVRTTQHRAIAHVRDLIQPEEPER